jgi:RNA polymerase sigma-70 factor, ECF subfamily
MSSEFSERVSDVPSRQPAEAMQVAADYVMSPDVYNSLNGMARRLTHSPDDANDAMGNTIVSIMAAAKKGRNVEALTSSSYLRTMLRNTITDGWRREHSSTRVSNVVSLDAEYQEGVKFADNASDTADRVVQRTLVSDIMSRIPLDNQQVIELVYAQQKTHAEAAEIIGIPVGTVKSRLWWARTLAHKALGEMGMTLEDVFTKE